MKGELDEVATTIQFKPDFENGALLTVVILCFCNS
jgi:aladin